MHGTQTFYFYLDYSFENNQPTPMIVDFHYYVGSAHNQMVENNWKNFALNNSILMLWPDGYNDAPHGYR